MNKHNAAFDEGYNAFLSKKLLTECPYAETSREFEAWVDGWEAAYQIAKDFEVKD